MLFPDWPIKNMLSFGIGYCFGAFLSIWHYRYHHFKTHCTANALVTLGITDAIDIYRNVPFLEDDVGIVMGGAFAYYMTDRIMNRVKKLEEAFTE